MKRRSVWGVLTLAAAIALPAVGAAEDKRPTAGPPREDAVKHSKDSDEALTAAVMRWKEKRTVPDFFIIVEHIPKGTPAKEVVEKYLGEPKQRSGYWATVVKEWYYIVEPPPNGAVCTVFVSQDEKFINARDKRKDK